MEIETTLAQSIRVTDGESKYDEACKRLLSEKPILARIPRINLCMKESLITISGSMPLPQNRGKVELIVNVEVQNDFYPGYPLIKRCLYYCCVSRIGKKGERLKNMTEIQQNTPINVAVFIDYENVYKALLKQHTNVLRLAFFEKLRKWCSKCQRRIVRIVVYCNFDNADLHESYHQSILQSYGVETIHTSNQGKNYADLKLTIDVLTSMYSNDNIDEFFVMSNDKDMTPLLNTIRANKRKVVIITTGDAYNPAICEFADKHIKLEEICKEVVEHKIIDGISESY